MNDRREKQAPKTPEPNATRAKDLKKVKRLGEQDADDTMEGEASPGLTVDGGGGHA